MAGTHSSPNYPSQLPYTVVGPTAPLQHLSASNESSYSVPIPATAPLAPSMSQTGVAEPCPIEFQPTNFKNSTDST